MDKFFKISERGSNVKTEIIAGLTTFFAMAYIIIVNPIYWYNFVFTLCKTTLCPGLRYGS